MAEQRQDAAVASGHEDLTDADVARLETVVRRVVRARVRDASTADDLTQEAMARLFERDMADIRDLDQYAVTVALNLVRRRWATEARDREALPEIIDLREAGEPDDALVDAEVAAALRDALDDLDPEKRAVLVAHEVEGVPTADLADDDTSPGAVAASLARTRARLRVGFVLRYRRVDLPDDGCRPVLEAISAHDTRRQERLDATTHLETCETCRDLAPVLRERGIAWLGLSPGIATLLRRREVQVGAAAAAVAVAVATVALARSDDSDMPRPPAEAAASAPEPEADDRPTATSAPPTTTAARPVPRPSPATPVPTPTEPPDRSEPPSRVSPTDPPVDVSEPPTTVEAPTVHLPADLPLVGEDLVLEHPLVDPVEPVLCPVLELPVPISSCRSDEPSDLRRSGGLRRSGP